MSVEGREQDLLDWVDDSLPPDRRAALDAHLAECGECRAAVRDLASLSTGLERLGPGPGVPSRRPGRGLGSLAPWAWAIAAGIVLAVAVPLLRDDPSPAPTGGVAAGAEPATVPGPDQLLAVERARRSGASPDVLAHWGRRSTSVPVRLAALAGGDGASGPAPGELADAFRREGDLVVRLWLVVAIARSGDADAIERTRAAVEALGEGAEPELREAVDAYLRRGGSA